MSPAVDERIAEQPVEPGHHRLIVPERFDAADPPHERLLQNVLGQGSTADALLQELLKLAMIGDE